MDTKISTTMRCEDAVKGNTSLTPDAGIETQYYGDPNPVALPKPKPGTGQPTGHINKNMGDGKAMPGGVPSDSSYD